MSLRWIKYHFWVLWILLFQYHPFQFKNYKIPAHFKPLPKIGTFIFVIVCQICIYLPVFLFVGTAINVGLFIPGVFIISIFGFAFSILFRYTLSDKATFINYDGKDVKYQVFGFYQLEEQIFKKDDLKSVVRLRHNFRGTNNHKVCLELQDGRLILLYLTIWKRKVMRKLEEISTLMNLPVNPHPTNGSPINDVNVSLGNK